MTPVKRLICHLLIVWLALLSGGAHAHAAADAAHALDHAALHAAVQDDGASTSPQAPQATATHGSEVHETCSLSHCGHGHATGMLPSLSMRLSDAPAGAPLPTLQAWAGREQPNTIERPQWSLTTPAVVNL